MWPMHLGYIYKAQIYICVGDNIKSRWSWWMPPRRLSFSTEDSSHWGANEPLARRLLPIPLSQFTPKCLPGQLSPQTPIYIPTPSPPHTHGMFSLLLPTLLSVSAAHNRWLLDVLIGVCMRRPLIWRLLFGGPRGRRHRRRRRD